LWGKFHLEILTASPLECRHQIREQWENQPFSSFKRQYLNKKAVLPQGNRAMPQVFFSVEVRQQLSLQV